MWSGRSSAEGTRMKAPKAPTGVGSEEGAFPAPVGVGSGEGLFAMRRRKTVSTINMLYNSCKHPFLPARRYASAGYSDRNVSVCPSVCPSVRHAPVLCQNEES